MGPPPTLRPASRRLTWQGSCSTRPSSSTPFAAVRRATAYALCAAKVTNRGPARSRSKRSGADCFPAKKPSHNGWCAAYGVHRWARPKEFALDDWRRQFAGQGITLHQADCLIAAATAGINAQPGDGQPRRLPHGRHHGRALACRALKASSLTADLRHPPTTFEYDRLTTAMMRATIGESDPAIRHPSPLHDGVRTTRADRRSFTSVHKTKRPPAHAGGRLAWSEPLSISSGDRIRTCDLWVMSKPPFVSGMSAEMFVCRW